MDDTPSAMTLYEALLFLHVLAAAAWFGAALLSLALVELSWRAGDTAGVVWLGRQDDRLAKLLFIPAALVVLGAGIWLVFEGPWSWGEDAWVVAGLVILLGTFALGLGLIVPTGARLLALAESGASPEELRPVIARLRLLSWIDVGVLALAIFLMTVKPF